MRRTPTKGCGAFTLIELLVVMVIMAILAGLVLSIVGVVMNNAKKSRAAGEVAALELALTRFQVDNGFYPTATNISILKSVIPNVYSTDPTTDPYKISGRALFLALTGRTMYNYSASATNSTNNYRQYIELKANQIGDADIGNTNSLDPTVESTFQTNTFSTGSYIIDPYRNAYGYYYNSTNASGVYSLYNKTLPDFWSTSGETTGTNATQSYIILRWIHNWPQNATP